MRIKSLTVGAQCARAKFAASPFAFAGAAALSAHVACVAPAGAQQFTQQGLSFFPAGQGAGVAGLGGSVALSADGNTAIAGGAGDNINVGAVWVYTRTGGLWSQQGSKLVATDATGSPRLGSSVALSADGNTAVAGGPNDASGAGAVWVFARTNGSWVQQGSKLVGLGAIGLAHQGTSVAISADGNTLVEGGYNDSNGTGAAWVFVQSGGIWTQQAELVGTGNAFSSRQGFSVAISGDGNTILSGGYNDNSPAGAVWPFARMGTTWTQQGPKLVGAGAVGSGAQQGWSVALSNDGNMAMVGGPADNAGVGAVWAFGRQNGVWSQAGNKLTMPGTTGAAGVGTSVAMSQNAESALVGAPGDNSAVGGAWAVRIRPVFSNVPLGLPIKLSVSPDSGANKLGSSVAVSGDGGTAVVGEPGNGSTSGDAWPFTMQEWEEIAFAFNIAGSLPAARPVDVNGDNKSDLFLYQIGASGILGDWRMNGLSAPTAAANLPSTDGTWTPLTVGHFYNSSENDLLFWNMQSGSIAIWRLSGDSYAGGAGVGSLPAPWQIAGFGDFNHDGVADILLRNSQTGAVAVWYMNAGAVSAGAVLGTVASNWTIAGTGDFAGNGYSDILWRDQNTGNVALWLLGGTAAAPTVMGVSVGAVSLDWQIVAIGDFNGDHRSDVLLQQRSTGNVAIWLMNGAVVTAGGVLGAVSGDFTVAGVGDYNGDGTADILWRQFSTGAASIWELNATAANLAAGTAIIGSGTVGAY